MLFKKHLIKRWFGSGSDHIDTQEDVAEQLTEQAKQLAIKQIVQQSRFAERDGLNEYDEDYSFFIPRGDLITAEMQHALATLEALDKQQTLVEKDSTLQISKDSDCSSDDRL